MQLLNNHVENELADRQQELLIEVHLPDGGKTMIRLRPETSMGEMLFYIAEKRGLDVHTIDLAETANGKKLFSMKGNISENKVKVVYVVEKRAGKAGKARGGSVRVGSRPASVFVPAVTAGAAGAGDGSHSDAQRLTSLLAEGVTLNDPRIPPLWRQLLEMVGISDQVLRDVQRRQQILDLVQRHGGPATMLQWPPKELLSTFSAVFNVKRQRTVKGSKPPPRNIYTKSSSTGANFSRNDSSDSDGNLTPRSRRRAPLPPGAAPPSPLVRPRTMSMHSKRPSGADEGPTPGSARPSVGSIADSTTSPEPNEPQERRRSNTMPNNMMQLLRGSRTAVQDGDERPPPPRHKATAARKESLASHLSFDIASIPLPSEPAGPGRMSIDIFTLPPPSLGRPSQRFGRTLDELRATDTDDDDGAYGFGSAKNSNDEDEGDDDESLLDEDGEYDNVGPEIAADLAELAELVAEQPKPEPSLPKPAEQPSSSKPAQSSPLKPATGKTPEPKPTEAPAIDLNDLAADLDELAKLVADSPTKPEMKPPTTKPPSGPLPPTTTAPSGPPPTTLPPSGPPPTTLPPSGPPPPPASQPPTGPPPQQQQTPQEPAIPPRPRVLDTPPPNPAPAKQIEPAGASSTDADDWVPDEPAPPPEIPARSFVSVMDSNGARTTPSPSPVTAEPPQQAPSDARPTSPSRLSAKQVADQLKRGNSTKDKDTDGKKPQRAASTKLPPPPLKPKPSRGSSLKVPKPKDEPSPSTLPPPPPSPAADAPPPFAPSPVPEPSPTTAEPPPLKATVEAPKNAVVVEKAAAQKVEALPAVPPLKPVDVVAKPAPAIQRMAEPPPLLSPKAVEAPPPVLLSPSPKAVAPPPIDDMLVEADFVPPPPPPPADDPEPLPVPPPAADLAPVPPPAAVVEPEPEYQPAPAPPPPPAEDTDELDLPPPPPELGMLPPPPPELTAFADDDALPPPPPELDGEDADADFAPPPPPPPPPPADLAGMVASTGSMTDLFSNIRRGSQALLQPTPHVERPEDPRDQLLKAVRRSSKDLLKAAPAPEPKAEEPRDAMLAAIRRVSKEDLLHAAPPAAPKPADPYDNLLSSIRQASRESLKTAPPLERKMSAHDQLLAAVRRSSTDVLKSVPEPEPRPPSPRNMLLASIRQANPLQRLRKTAQPSSPLTQVDGRNALLVSLGAMGRGRQSLRRVSTSQTKKAARVDGDSMQQALARALDGRREAMDDDQEDDQDDDQWD